MKDSVIVAVFANLAVLLLATSGQPRFNDSTLPTAKQEQSSPDQAKTDYFAAHQLSLCAIGANGLARYQVSVNQCVMLSVPDSPQLRNNMIAQSR